MFIYMSDKQETFDNFDFDESLSSFSPSKQGSSAMFVESPVAAAAPGAGLNLLSPGNMNQGLGEDSSVLNKPANKSSFSPSKEKKKIGRRISFGESTPQSSQTNSPDQMPLEQIGSLASGYESDEESGAAATSQEEIGVDPAVEILKTKYPVDFQDYINFYGIGGVSMLKRDKGFDPSKKGLVPIYSSKGGYKKKKTRRRKRKSRKKRKKRKKSKRKKRRKSKRRKTKKKN